MKVRTLSAVLHVKSAALGPAMTTMCIAYLHDVLLLTCVNMEYTEVC